MLYLHPGKEITNLYSFNFVTMAFIMRIIFFSVFVGFASASATEEDDVGSLLQKPILALKGETLPSKEVDTASKPHIIELRRESVPIYRRGKIASFKTSYSGVLSVGSPAQDFRVVFDTGSAHVVLPAAECKSEACLVPGRRRFDQAHSTSSHPINADGSTVADGELGEQVNIGFGTGQITGEFAKDKVCFGKRQTADELSATKNGEANAAALAKVGEGGSVDYSPLCVEMSLVVAVEMSSQPFKTFQFDGILGLSLDGLSLNKNFSAFDMLVQSGMAAQPVFSVFLTEGEDGEASEVAMGGIDARRHLEPLTWSKVPMHEMGYWQVRIKAVRINGEELDVCKDGTCRGVVDTGTSHLGVPSMAHKDFAARLTTDAGDVTDCRLVKAPIIEIELDEKNITLHPFNYMRRLPLRDGVTVSSSKGVDGTSSEPIVLMQGQDQTSQSGQALPGAKATSASKGEQAAKHSCSPRTMAVKMPEPLGPKLFILGEPVLHRYYTAYDWEQKRVGFSLANNRWNTMKPSELASKTATASEQVDMLLLQKSVKVTKKRVVDDEVQEETAFMQVKVSLRVRRV
eukprot:TRINITY_DN64000_c0_g1_i1.p1 TRINITY_DN64000_c0_g1~~TRINITY_DN64000_c0_g1_i1.p1  ORF type:complete len:573 (+),score=120.78 TRINITY_DN64000_c0_g1_i1:39-1757(+)